jgi:hypothetical protein
MAGGASTASETIPTEVAAAAVVPVSSVSTKALCCTSLIFKGWEALISEKLALSEKALPNPKFISGFLRLVP